MRLGIKLKLRFICSSLAFHYLCPLYNHITTISTTMHLSSDTILQGGKYTYRIIKKLGQGTFGITYLATTRIVVDGPLGKIGTDIQVAVKEFFMRDINGREGSAVTASNKSGLFDSYRRKFVREAQNISHLSHPNIVSVLEVFDANNTTYYVMEYCEGGSMDGVIAEQNGLQERVALKYFTQIASALQYMHNSRMLHLDLKPGNIVMRSKEEAILIDFGLSKQYDENGNPESSTSIGGGTPGYAPTEQADYRGDGTVFPVTMDVYALGGTLYKMLTGKQPPEASVVLNDGLSLTQLERRGVSRTTIAAIEKAMSPRRKDRYQSVKEFVQALGCDIPEEVNNNTQNKAKEKYRSNPIDEATVPADESTVPADEKTRPVNEKTRSINRDTVPGGGDATKYVGNKAKQKNAASHNKHNGYEYVDLGLPSGLKWATCNIGAYSPEEYGNYYAWGETSTKSEYTEENSQTYYGENLGDISGNAWYDAARANWGGSWRMPTKAEFKELIDHCDWQWTTQNGVNGYKVTSKTNGNSIFLPAAGFYVSLQSSAGVYGDYWSSTPYEVNTGSAYYLYFYSGNLGTYWIHRVSGRTVRPVLDDNRASKKTISTTTVARKQTPTPTPTFTTRDTIAGKEYVDLGLPSGLKWATCNVGANSPTGYGNYYAWGEISTKSEYTEKNSKTYYSSGNSIKNFFRLSNSSNKVKICNDISGDARYDAARANWGGSWRMPREAEFKELIDHCVWQWTTQNGVKGYKVTSKTNGNSIFLPAAGYKYGSSQRYDGENGNYWGATPDEDSADCAFNLSFYSGNHGTNWGHRYLGHSVRPVSD